MPLRDFTERYPALVPRLLQAQAGRRVGHAYLLVGDHAETLLAVARAWVQACVCPARRPDGDACGQCPTCTHIAAGRCPGVDELVPRMKSRQIGIDEVRELEENLHLTGGGGRLKIGIICDAHRLTLPAQNAFLKTLEEPTQDSLLVLTTTQPGVLLPTIRSRCQQLLLLDNRVGYQFTGYDALLAALPQLRRQKGALVAVGVADQILAVLKEFAAEASAEAKEYRARFPPNSELDKPARDRLAEEVDAVGSSGRLVRREQLLSVLHTWAAQEYLRAQGVALAALPNPEMYAKAPAETTAQPPPLAEAHRALELTEDLLRTLACNVAEDMAVQDYCQQLCAKG